MPCAFSIYYYLSVIHSIDRASICSDFLQVSCLNTSNEAMEGNFVKCWIVLLRYILSGRETEGSGAEEGEREVDDDGLSANDARSGPVEACNHIDFN